MAGWKNLTGYYVYTYLNEDGTPYYVGMGQNRRVVDYHKYVKVPEWNQIKIIDNITLEQAHELEIKLIEKYGLKCNGTGILENLQAGGKTQKSGWYHSQQSKERISQGNTGKHRTEEQRKNYSKPKTAAHAEKIRQANIGRSDDGRYAKIGVTKSKQKWYNDGVNSIMRIPGTEPAGFKPGRLNWRNA
jgi:hypothetical protein